MLEIKISNSIRFYRYIGKELRAQSSTLLKTVPLQDKAETCFSECVNTFGCQSFNVYESALERYLLCDLLNTTNGQIFESVFKEHFTTSNAYESITTSQTISSDAISVTVTTGVPLSTSQFSLSTDSTSISTQQDSSTESTSNPVTTEMWPSSLSSPGIETTTTTTLSATSHLLEENPIIADDVLFTIETMDMCLKWQQQSGKFESKLEAEPCMLFYFKVGIVVFTPNGNTRCMFRGSGNVLGIKIITNSDCINFVGISTASTQLKFSSGGNLCLGIDNTSEAKFMTCTSVKTHLIFKETGDAINNDG